jgi:antitoxin component YwqK of YwqJK toxin-antitoxin module
VLLFKFSAGRKCSASKSASSQSGKTLAIIMRTNVTILLILLFVSCGVNTSKKQSVSCSDLMIIDGIAYIDGQPYTGKCETRENNVLILSVDYRNGKENGFVKQYYSNGNIMESVQYQDGIPNGLATYFDPEGVIEQEGQVIHNKKEGTWKVYWDKNSINRIENYKNDLLEDSMFIYNRNGILCYKGLFQKGKKQGKWIIYDSISGHFNGYMIYENDVLEYDNDERVFVK